MGRTVAYDCFVQEQLKDIIKSKIFITGLIIGQCTEQKDVVLRMCPTPSSEDVCEDSNEDSATPRKKKPQENSKTLQLDEQWISQHAKQLLRALPGGLNILGFYAFVRFDLNVQQHTQLKQVLYTIYKTITQNKKLNIEYKDRVVLSVCSATGQMICKTYNITDIKASANPADWKFQANVNKYNRIRCQMAVDLKFPVRVENSGHSLQKQMEIGLGHFLNSIQIAYVLLDGQQRQSDELLDISQKSKKKNFNKNETVSGWHDAEIFLPLESNPASKLEIFDCACMMTFKGTVHCRAYTHAKATVKETINALKEDIVRSMIARCEIHCEDLLLIEEEQKDPMVVHELPRRVFAPLPQEGLCVCDYQFHSDTASDSLDAFKELLNLEVAEEDVDISCEISPTTSTLILPEAMEDRLSEFGDTPTHTSKTLLIPVAGVVATLAVGVASFLLMSYDN